MKFNENIKLIFYALLQYYFNYSFIKHEHYLF